MVCCIQQRHRVGYIGFSERSALTPGTFVLKLLFSSFTFLSFTLPALQRARKAMTQPARVTAFSFCPEKGKLQAFWEMLHRAGMFSFDAQKRTRKAPAISTRWRRRVAAPCVCFVPWAALASCRPLPQQLLPVSAAGRARRRCTGLFLRRLQRRRRSCSNPPLHPLF